MSLRDNFQTDTQLEQNGVEFDYGDAVITMARAGGSNRKYKASLAKAIRPYRAALDADTLKEEQILPVLMKEFVDHIILDWKTSTYETVDGKQVRVLKQGIESADGGEPIPFTKANALNFLREVPEFYYRLSADASSPKAYLKDLEAAAKN